MDAVFNDSCILDILDFIKQLSAAHNLERPRTGLQHGQLAICPSCQGTGKAYGNDMPGNMHPCEDCGGSGKQQA